MKKEKKSDAPRERSVWAARYGHQIERFAGSAFPRRRRQDEPSEFESEVTAVEDRHLYGARSNRRPSLEELENPFANLNQPH